MKTSKVLFFILAIFSCSMEDDDAMNVFDNNYPKAYSFSSVSSEQAPKGFYFDGTSYQGFDVANSSLGNIADSIEVYVFSRDFYDPLLEDNGYREITLMNESTIKIHHTDPDTILTLGYHLRNDDIIVIDSTYSPPYEWHIASIDSINDQLFIPFLFTYFDFDLNAQNASNAQTSPEMELYNYENATLLDLYNLSVNDTIIMKYGRIDFDRM